MTDSDAKFLSALEDCVIPNAEFRHRDHLRAAWLYVTRYGYQHGIVKMSRTIQTFAAHHGHQHKFHATLTTVWVKLVAAHVARHAFTTFDDFIGVNAELLDKHLPLHFYSRDTLFSDRARSQWIEPDVRKLPAA